MYSTAAITANVVLRKCLSRHHAPAGINATWNPQAEQMIGSVCMHILNLAPYCNNRSSVRQYPRSTSNSFILAQPVRFCGAAASHGQLFNLLRPCKARNRAFAGAGRPAAHLSRFDALTGQRRVMIKRGPHGRTRSSYLGYSMPLHSCTAQLRARNLAAWAGRLRDLGGRAPLRVPRRRPAAALLPPL